MNEENFKLYRIFDKISSFSSHIIKFNLSIPYLKEMRRFIYTLLTLFHKHNRHKKVIDDPINRPFSFPCTSRRFLRSTLEVNPDLHKHFGIDRRLHVAGVDECGNGAAFCVSVCHLLACDESKPNNCGLFVS